MTRVGRYGEQGTARDEGSVRFEWEEKHSVNPTWESHILSPSIFPHSRHPVTPVRLCQACNRPSEGSKYGMAWCHMMMLDVDEPRLAG